MIRHRQPGMVDLAGWHAIDAEERRRGAAQGRPRVKITDVHEAMRIAAAATLPRVARLRKGLPV
jgi:ferredoxin--NADP+ reductase